MQFACTYVDGKYKRSCMHDACMLLAVDETIKRTVGGVYVQVGFHAGGISVVALFTSLFFHAVIFGFYCTWSCYLSSHNCYLEGNQLLFKITKTIHLFLYYLCCDLSLGSVREM